MSGIYIHVPFCKQACHYCNFHFSTSLKYMDDMVAAIVRELELRRAYISGEEVETIYFGGGTPSLLSEAGLNHILERVCYFFKVNDKVEITLEANPDDLSKDKLKVLENSMVNRLSIGVQSFHEEELRWMNRAHSAEESVRSIRDAQEAGFENISMDLIFGIPKGSHEKWEQNLHLTSSLRVPHISMYALTVEPGTALGRWVEKGREAEAPDDYVVEQFDMGMDLLGEAGYEHYEISNYALPGQEARHNSNYWRSRNYLGVGPSAHSYNGSSRTMNLAHNAQYITAVQTGAGFSETEELDEATKYNEYVMTRLRTSWGVALDEISVEQQVHFLSAIKLLINKGWVHEKFDVYRLTREGKHFADAAAMELFV